MSYPPFLADRRALDDAGRLMETFGEGAAAQAVARAARSRDIGNHIHFCRWRETARLIEVLAGREAEGPVH